MFTHKRCIPLFRPFRSGFFIASCNKCFDSFDIFGCFIDISAVRYDLIADGFGRTIKNIVQYLEAELTNDPLRYEELVSEVAKQYKSMFPPRGGLSEFYIWDDSYEVRYTSNHEYEQIKSQIEAILSKYM